jgi:lipopolysaccharide export system permease protein
MVIRALPILDKYIAKQVLLTILVVAIALLGLDIFFNIVNELKVVGRGQYTLQTLFLYLLLSSPTRLYIMFPWAALIGSLISLGALAAQSELVVMRASSISVLRITWAVVKAALILTLFAVFLGEGIAPAAERLAQQKKTFALSGGQSIETAYGLWVRQGYHFIHIQSARVNGELIGVTRYEFDEKQKLLNALYAVKATRVGKAWRLEEIKKTHILETKTIVTREKEQIIPDLIDPGILETASVKHPEWLSLKALFHTIKHHAKNELNTQNYELALYKKLFQPLVIILMVILAVPFIFGPLRSSNLGFRILVGILVAFLFHTLNGMLAPLALVYQFPPILAVLLPIVLFAGIGLWMLKRVG